MKKDKFIRTILLYSLSSIILIIHAIRVAMTYVLEVPLLVLYLMLIFVTIYSIIGPGIMIYREHKNNQN